MLVVHVKSLLLPFHFLSGNFCLNVFAYFGLVWESIGSPVCSENGCGIFVTILNLCDMVVVCVRVCVCVCVCVCVYTLLCLCVLLYVH